MPTLGGGALDVEGDDLFASDDERLLNLSEFSTRDKITKY
jgi:hypothetical protein